MSPCAGSSFTLAAALTLAAISAACTDQDSHATGAKDAPPPVPVVASAAVKKTMPLEVSAIGNVETIATVAVKSRVDGQIVGVYFKDGQDLTRGQILFRIDPRPFEAALKQAQATLARDRAQLDYARSQERRYQDLVEKHFVSKEAYAQVRTNLEAAAATVQADEAAVENAKLQLAYTEIRSPIAGRAGKILVQQGNLVKANDTNPLVIINQMSPIYVSFAVPEQYLPEIRQREAQAPLTVRAAPPEASPSPETGTLAFIDNAVDPATGTIKLKASFDNRDRALWPGQFVNVVLTLGEQPDAVIVPSQALQTGPRGQYVFVIKPDSTVELREVVVDRTRGGETVIGRGLAPGERVVTDGQSRLVPGAKVIVKAPS